MIRLTRYENGADGIDDTLRIDPDSIEAVFTESQRTQLHMKSGACHEVVEAPGVVDQLRAVDLAAGSVVAAQLVRIFLPPTPGRDRFP